MRERPIIERDGQVRAILEGRKSQTRRVIKLPPDHMAGGFVLTDGGDVWMDYQVAVSRPEIATAIDLQSEHRCPYGVIGDRLWLKEAWNKEGGAVSYRADGDWIADYRAAAESGIGVPRRPDLKWIPSVSMPRWASRIILEVTDVRVERLQDISEEDARAEGFEYEVLQAVSGEHKTARDNFSIFWDNTRGNGSWASNPWCWVLTFSLMAEEKATAPL